MNILNFFTIVFSSQPDAPSSTTDLTDPASPDDQPSDLIGSDRLTDTPTSPNEPIADQHDDDVVSESQSEQSTPLTEVKNFQDGQQDDNHCLDPSSPSLQQDNANQPSLNNHLTTEQGTLTCRLTGNLSLG